MDWGWIGRNLPEIWDLMLQHIVLSLVPIVISLVVSIPLGYLAYARRNTRGALLTIADVFYTIPGLALLLLLPPTLNIPYLSPVSLEIALTVYGVALLIRSVADGFASVSRDVVGSATAIGYAPWRRFWGVELRLAVPVVVAGLRVVSVSTISLATLGALVGQNTLGSLFIEGFQLSFPTEIIVGIVAVVILAGVFDVVISSIGRALTPWTRAGRDVRRRATATKAVSA